MNSKTGRVLVVDSKYSEIDRHMKDMLDFAAPDLAGKSVLIKPNLLFYTEPEQGLNTHPAVLGALVAECERRGASRIFLGDNAGQIMYGNSKSAFYESSEMGDRFGKYYVNMGLDLEPFRLKSIDRIIYIPKILRKADVVINVPKFKTHGLTGISGAIKNTFGYVPGAQKAKVHFLTKMYEPFAKALIEVHRIRTPDLHIVDAILGMEGRGPFSRRLRYIGQVLVSKDPVALDAVLCRMIGFRPEDLCLVRLAQEAGLGVYDNIEVVGEPKIMSDYGLPPNSETPWALNGPAGVVSESITRDAHRVRVEIDTQKCVRCGACVRECPAQVLEMKDFPIMNKRECASCHACQEVCETKALFLASSVP